MSEQTERFQELRKSPSAWVDASSLKALAEGCRRNRLTAEFETDQHLKDAERMIATGPLRAAMSVLERLAIYGVLVADRRVLQVEKVANDINSLFRQVPEQRIIFVPIPDEVYIDVAEDIKELPRILSTKTCEALSDIDQYDYADEAYHDFLFEGSSLGSRLASVANTGQSLERTFFYVQLSRAAHTPVCLHPSKQPFLDRLIEMTVPDSLTRVQKYLDERLDESLQEVCGRLPVRLPPLTDWMLRLARRNDATLLETALHISETEEAKEFRGWLQKLQEELYRCFHEDGRMSDAESTLHELQKVGEKWAEHGDPRVGIDYERRVINLSALPYIGDVFDAGGAGRIEVKDPILNPSGPLHFVSRWYWKDE